jgi:hypothetical protein
MPNSIFFTKIGHAIHGTYEVRNLGRPASHGCVRLAPQNAAILYALVKDEGVFNTRVRLVGEIPKGSDLVAGRDRTGDQSRTTYARNGIADDTDADYAPPPQRRYRTQYNSPPSYYYQRPYPYYERRYYGRGFFNPFGW